MATVRSRGMLLPLYTCLVSLQCTLSKPERKDIMQLAEAGGATIVQVEAYDAIKSARKKEVLVVLDNPSTWKHESKDGERVVSVDWILDSISSIKLGQPHR
jgi:hypothetical protein